MSERKVVLVTGASSGIGRSIARELAGRGWTVFGTSRRPAQVPPWPDGRMLPLDVRDDRSARECIGTVLEREGRFDALVNNAGYSLAGASEEATVEQARALFETNFFGAVRMVHAVLPTMRRQAEGRIVNISSGVALARPPFLGMYAASKCALEGYSEALRHELRPWNIRVCVVRPGFFRSNIGEKTEEGADRIDEYAPWRERALATFRDSLRRSGEPVPVARRVARILARSDPPLYHDVGLTGLSALRRLLPSSWFLGTIRRFSGLG